MPFALSQARGDHCLLAMQIDDAHLGPPAGQEVAITALERRAGDHTGCTRLPPAVDPVCYLLKPGPSVAVIERVARVHLCDVGWQMKLIAFLKRPAQLFR